MRTLLTLIALLFVFTVTAAAQNSNSSATTSASNTNTTKKRGPVFRATKDQIMQAQGVLKQRSFYSGEQTGKLDDPTRTGLKEYQKAEGIKVTGTLNKEPLEKMGIPLTDKQKTM